MPTAEKLSITLTPAQAKLVRDEVETGRYGSVSEVVRDALRAWQKREEQHRETIEVIRSRIGNSVDDPRSRLSAGDVLSNIEDHHKSASASS